MTRAADAKVGSSLSANEFLLSVCIPTYNFGRFIGATLDSMVNQLTPEVQIVVLDGASTDDTPDVVSRFQGSVGGIYYHRMRERGGIDRDMAACVDLARGRYCWLFSADDLMRPRAIERVLAWLDGGSDVHLFRHSDCTFDMRRLADHPVLRSPIIKTFDLHEREQRLEYFSLAETTEAFFSFMGGLVVKRETWRSIPLNEAFVGSCWAHAARLFELMKQRLRASYHPDVLLDRRGDNDSFADRGVVNRYRIGIQGYHTIADTFFGPESDMAFHVRRVVRAEYGFHSFLRAELKCRKNPKGEDVALLRSLLEQCYRDVPTRGRLIGIGSRCIPEGAYLAVRALYRHIRRA